MSDWGRTLRSIDAFRSIPEDFVVTTSAGLFLTVVSALTCLAIFVCELHDFLVVGTSSHLEVDSNQEFQLRIHFDIAMHEIPCEYITVGVWDTFGTDRSNITRNIVKTRLKHVDDGSPVGYSEEELTDIEYGSQKLTEEQLKEFNSDWTSAEDRQFEHSDFRSALEAHDFTFVLFCIQTHGPCRLFIPLWNKFTSVVHGGKEMLDANGDKADVRALQINCADDAFGTVCKEQKVRSFPTIRLYRRSIGTHPAYAEIDFAFPDAVIEQARRGKILEFTGEALNRLTNAVMDIALDRVKKFHLHVNATIHSMFDTGCRLAGSVDVPRVPGTMHLETAAWDKSMNAAFTNVSHTVHHLSFADTSTVGAVQVIPEEYRGNVKPIDGKDFTVPAFHLGPHHYLKILHTKLHGKSQKIHRFYQATHQWNHRRFARDEIPKARFSFDLAPLEVVIERHSRAWYDFLTSVAAMIGGTWAVASMSVTWSRWIVGLVKGS